MLFRQAAARLELGPRRGRGEAGPSSAVKAARLPLALALSRPARFSVPPPPPSARLPQS